MLHLEMVIPSLKSNASFTAALRTDGDVLMDVKTIINLPETHYQQKASLKYGYWQPSSTQLSQDKDRLRTCVLIEVLVHLFVPFCRF